MAFGHISDIFSNIYLYYFSFDLFILWKKLSNNWWFQSNWSCESLRAAQDPPPFPRSDSGAQYGYIWWKKLSTNGSCNRVRRPSVCDGFSLATLIKPRLLGGKPLAARTLRLVSSYGDICSVMECWRGVIPVNFP